MKRKIIIICIVIGFGLVISGVLLTCPSNSKQNSEFVMKENEMDVLSKTEALENYFLAQYPIKSISDISNQDKLFFALTVLGTDANRTFSQSKISDILKKYFGSALSYQNGDIFLPNTKKVIYKYVLKKKEYIFQNENDYVFHPNYSFISSSSDKKEKDSYQIEKQYLYMNKSTSNYILYATIDDCLNDTNSLGNFDSNNYQMDYTLISQYHDQLKKVVYDFKTENGNYILKAIELK